MQTQFRSFVDARHELGHDRNQTKKTKSRRRDSSVEEPLPTGTAKPGKREWPDWPVHTTNDEVPEQDKKDLKRSVRSVCT